MESFTEFFEPVTIAVPTLIPDSPYTDLSFDNYQTKAIVRFASGISNQRGEKLTSGSNSILKTTIIQCYFTLADKDNLNLKYIIIWKGEKYKIISIKIQEYVVPGIIIDAERIDDASIF